jgi:hypothetical protein
MKATAFHATAKSGPAPRSARGASLKPPAVSPSITLLQARLEVGPVDDPFEREADAVAHKIVDAPAAACGDGVTDPGSSKRAVAGAAITASSSGVQLQSDGGATQNGAGAPPIVHEVLRSPGMPLDLHSRAFMEARFGRSFENVRVHTGPRAAASARAIGAKAYTAGRNVVFGEGRYAPHSSAGQRLLAHELTHVAQQSGGCGARLGGRQGVTALSALPAPAIQRADENELPFLDGWIVEHTASAAMGNTGWHFLRELLRGFLGGMRTNLKQGAGDHVKDRLHSLLTSPAAMADFYLHYVVGLAKGIVSPIVDLWHLISGLLQLNMKLSEWLIAKAAEVFRHPEIVVARAKDVRTSLDELSEKVGKEFASFTADPVASVKRLSDWLDAMMEKALDKTRAKGHEVADDVLRFIDLPWAEMGDKIGSVVGAVLMQILLAVFSEGIGNLLSEAGALLGRAGARVGAEFMNLVRAAGAFLTKTMEGVKALGGTLMKGFEAIFADLLKLFEKLKALFEVAAEEFQLGKLATAGEAPPQGFMSRAIKFEPKGTRTTTTTVEQLTGKAPKGAGEVGVKPSAKPQPGKGIEKGPPTGAAEQPKLPPKKEPGSRFRFGTRTVDQNGELTDEGVKVLREKFPSEFKGDTNQQVKDAFARDITIDRKGRLHEALIKQEVSEAYGESKSAFVMSEDKNFDSIFKEVETRSAGKVQNKSILGKKAGNFIDSDPVLQAQKNVLETHKNPEVQRIWKEWYADFKEGTVGAKKPDIIEFLLDRDLAVVSDPTLATPSLFGPVHEFKTLFYKRVIEKVTSLEVGAMDIAPGLVSVVGK